MVLIINTGCGRNLYKLVRRDQCVIGHIFSSPAIPLMYTAFSASLVFAVVPFRGRIRNVLFVFGIARCVKPGLLFLEMVKSQPLYCNIFRQKNTRRRLSLFSLLRV